MSYTMATVPQPARPAQRTSSGRDILSRMLQMEKQSKQQRSSSASPTPPLPRERTSFLGPPDQLPPSPNMAPKPSLPTPPSFLRPSLMPRAQTVPSLSTDARPVEKPMPSLETLKIDTSNNDVEPGPAEICLSPSWSDHGEKKRKKEKKKMEKEQKEAEKRLKQEQERQRLADIKAGKRLSKKPPPAAMETQKMPQALRRNSWVSMMSSRTSSGENTRRSSREERRLSIGSMDSQSHSRSTPATSTEEASDPPRSLGQWHSIVSSAAPKLPNFGWSSRRTSTGTNKSISWGSEDAYTKEIISFAYRIEGSPSDSEHNELNPVKARQEPTTPTRQEAKAPTFIRSVTAPDLASFTQEPLPRSPQRSPKRREDRSEPRIQPGPKETPREHKTSAQSLKASPDFQSDLAGEMEAIIASHHPRSSHDLSSPRSPKSRLSNDGSSYVHKQRMYQQQRSIAGFEDEQAVKYANDVAAKLEGSMGEDGRQPALGLTVSDTDRPHNNTVLVESNDHIPVSPITKGFVTQPDVKLSSVKQQSPVEHRAEVAPSRSPEPNNDTKAVAKQSEGTPNRTPSLSVRDLVSLSKTQTAPGFKTDKILSFRRRSKQAPSKISVPDNVQNKLVAHQSGTPAVTVIEEPTRKRSKGKHVAQEIKPSLSHASRRKTSENSTRSQPKEGLPDSTPALSPTRNRSSSSQVLGDSGPSLVSPKATTEPVPGSNKAANQGEAKDDGKVLHPEAEPVSPRSKRMNPVITDKALPDTPHTPPAAEGESTSEATTNKVSPTAKSIPEVVVESTTEEGLVRKTSIKRPRSNPQLQTQTTVTNPLPSLDFLPQLKHQPLVKRQPHFLPVTKDRFPPVPKDYATIKSMAANKTSVATNAPDLKLIPRSPLRPSQFPVPGRTFNRSSTEVGTVSSFGKSVLAEGMEAKPMAKLFVICCKCKFWHDLPSKLYEAMALPKELHKDENVAGGRGKGKVTEARLETAVKCPWCEHAMTTWCCQGWTTVVYLHERHH